MKLIIQIPCFNEEVALPVTLATLPRKVAGFDTVEWLVIDDGSSDRTTEVAQAFGADHIVRLRGHQGLARAFMAGLDAGLRLKADVIVNTDADNQYSAACISALVRPVADKHADMAIGVRPIAIIDHFSSVKKRLQKVGSWVVTMASGVTISDAASGFRAFNVKAAATIYVFNKYTYTIETLIQAGRKNLTIAEVPIEVNGFLRPSRLVLGVSNYVWRSALTILRIFVLYKPLRFFFGLGTVLLVPGLVLGMRFLYFFATDDGQGHVQSLILAAMLGTIGVGFYACGILADLLSANRLLIEDIRTRARLEERQRASADE